MDFESIVKQALVNIFESNAVITKEDLDILLSTEENNKPRQKLIGYPRHPLYKEIAAVLQLWMTTKHCPVLDLPSYHMLDEEAYIENRTATIAAITPLLEGLEALWNDWGDGEKVYRVQQVLLKLGKRGVLDLIGVRKTVGSVEMWPPSKKKLEESLNEKHNPKSELSVGARALAKHFHRDGSNSWWGQSTGTEQAKNQHVQQIVNTILNGASWINMHQLPGQLPILEVRQAEGYGARWSVDGTFFRGFLEPQMEDGHAVGWRH